MSDKAKPVRTKRKDEPAKDDDKAPEKTRDGRKVRTYLMERAPIEARRPVYMSDVMYGTR